MENNTRLAHFKNMVAVAIADGQIDQEENNFLIRKANEFGITSEEVAAILSIASELPFIVPETDVEREEQLADAVYMAMVNGEISTYEYELCLRIAGKLGYTQKDVDALIRLIQKLWRSA